jgi:subtilisin-like proprotein convertase family protein
MKTIILLLGSATFAPAALTFSSLFPVNTTIPDYNPTGLLFTQNISGSGITSISSLQVMLTVTGGWNGDLFAYLAHETGFAVLLNRIGRTDLVPDGSSSSGFAVTFDDAGAGGDIHLAAYTAGQPLTGTFAPDARADSPLTVTDSTIYRTEFLSSFTGLPGDGDWELFVADLSTGFESQLVSWGVTMTDTSMSAIPEPGSFVALGGLLAAGLCVRHRHHSRKRQLGKSDERATG